MNGGKKMEAVQEKLHTYGIGDYVMFQYAKNQEYPGSIKGKEKDEFIVEICVNRKKSENNEIEIVRGKQGKLRPMLG
jgi:hypothetical protein